MNRFLKFSVALPLLALATGCSSDKDPLEIPEGDFNVVMTISGAESRAPRPLSDEIKNLKKKNLNFATYGADKMLKHFLFQGSTNSSNPDVEALYFEPNWGPSVAAKLPREQYNGDFYLACFNMPSVLRAKEATQPFTLANLNNTSMAFMEWPGTSETSFVWNPDDTTNETLMPMAGIVKVTPDYMKQYNEYVYGSGETPFAMPDINMTRALAKVVIIDNAGLIESVDLKSPKYGSLVPELDGWMDEKTVLKPLETSRKDKIIQTLEKPTYTQADGKNVYVFYTFEQSFYKADGTLAPADDAIRAVATLHANKDSGLQGTKRETTPVRFAPYKDGIVNTDPKFDLKTEDDGAWQGVMRNTVYTFRVDAPLQGGVTISVTTSPWKEVKGDPFTF